MESNSGDNIIAQISKISGIFPVVLWYSSFTLMYNMGHSVWWKMWFKRSINELTAPLDDLKPKLISFNILKMFFYNPKACPTCIRNSLIAHADVIICVYQEIRISENFRPHLHAYLFANMYAQLQANWLHICITSWRGIKYISVLNDWQFWIISWFKMSSKLHSYHDLEGSSSWSRWLLRKDHKASSNCSVHIKRNVCIIELQSPDVCRTGLNM